MSQKNKFKETEIGEIVKLGEIVDIKTGKLDSNYAEEGGKNPFFTCAPFPLRINDFAFDSEAILLAGNNANGIFHLNYYNGKFNAYQRTYVITVKDDSRTNLGYLYYHLHLSLNMLRHFSQGTSTKFLTMKILDSLEIVLPKIEEQRKISKILSDLDLKIKLSKQMNKTLLALGQAIFKRWFIGFEFPDEKGKSYKISGGDMVDSSLGKVPKDWQISKLGQFLKITKGCSYRSVDLKKSDKALVTLKSINREGGFNQEGYKEYIGSYKEEQVVKNGEIVVAQTDITQDAEVIGTPAIINSLNQYNKLIASLDLQILRIKDRLNNGFLYFLLKTAMFHNHALSYTNGTTVLHLNKDAVPNFEFSLPNSTVLKPFGQISNAIIEKMNRNEHEIFVLSQIRDSLLPRLMSGKIRVPVEVRT